MSKIELESEQDVEWKKNNEQNESENVLIQETHYLDRVESRNDDIISNINKSESKDESIIGCVGWTDEDPEEEDKSTFTQNDDSGGSSIALEKH